VFGDKILGDDEKDDAGGEKRNELDAEFIHIIIPTISSTD
jgi:hypothetical protein